MGFPRFVGIEDVHATFRRDVIGGVNANINANFRRITLQNILVFARREVVIELTRDRSGIGGSQSIAIAGRFIELLNELELDQWGFVISDIRFLHVAGFVKLAVKLGDAFVKRDGVVRSRFLARGLLIPETFIDAFEREGDFFFVGRRKWIVAAAARSEAGYAQDKRENEVRLFHNGFLLFPL